eukprot:8322677-Pyramimonas_sp.AAC.1
MSFIDFKPPVKRARSFALKRLMMSLETCQTCPASSRSTLRAVRPASARVLEASSFLSRTPCCATSNVSFLVALRA